MGQRKLKGRLGTIDLFVPKMAGWFQMSSFFIYRKRAILSVLTPSIESLINLSVCLCVWNSLRAYVRKRESDIIYNDN
jgi:hypothetical protein